MERIGLSILDVQSVIQSLDPEHWANALLEELEQCCGPWVLLTTQYGVWRIRDADLLNERLNGLRPGKVCIILRKEVEKQALLADVRSCLSPSLWNKTALQSRLRSGSTAIPGWQYLISDIEMGLPVGALEVWSFDECGIQQTADFSSRLGYAETHIFPIMLKQRDDAQMHAESPVVSVLMPVYNEAQFLAWAIRSVQAQTRKEWELLIGDDGSTDLTASIAEAIPDKRIRVLRFAKNRGKAYVLNDLMKIVKGRYVLELDADDWLSPNALESLIHCMEQAHPSVGLATGSYHIWTKSGKGELIYRGEATTGYEFHWKKAMPPIPRFYKTEAIHRVGGWPTDDMLQGRLFEDIAMYSKVSTLFQTARIHESVYHRLLRRDSVSSRSRSLYPAWAQSWFNGRA